MSRIKSILTLAILLLVTIPVGTASGDAPLLQLTDLKYQGAFRVPQDGSFDFGGVPLAYNPAHNSLFIVGNAQEEKVAEISIPQIINSNNLSDLRTAAYLQPFTDITEGHMRNIMAGGGYYSQSDVFIGGLLSYNSKLIGAVYDYFDASGDQVLSHFSSNPELATSGDFKGMYQVGNLGAGLVSAYMTPVPAEWQTSLGGPVITGNCCIPVITRTSFGPAAFTFDPDNLGKTGTVSAMPLLYYTQSHPLVDPKNPPADPWAASNTEYFNGATMMGGVVLPQGTRSVLFFGRQGTGEFCYGPPFNDPACDGRDLWTNGDAHGCHAYPYRYQIWAYDANDLAAVKSGQKNPWDLMPQIWPFDLPFQRPADGREMAVTYDPPTQRIFISAKYQDGPSDSYKPTPVIHVFRVQVPGATSTLPTPPANLRVR
jgi:hypothetical protein